MKEDYLLSILSGDRKGLLSIITSMLNRRGIEMESIHAGRTDKHDEVLITIEVIAELSDIKNMSAKIGNIIEVQHVEYVQIKDAWYQKVALYAIEKNGYNSETYRKLQKFGAVMVGYYRNEVIIQKTRRDEDLQHLYNELDGPYLKGFSKSAAILLKPLEEQSSVISMAE